MISNKLEKPYESYPIRVKLTFICDYCGAEFVRDKKSRERLNINIAKDSCGKKECKQAKREEVFIKNYGNKNIFATDSFKEKQKQKNLDKFGEEEYFNSDDFKIKRAERMIEKYDTIHPLQSEEILQRQQQTMVERHGVVNPAHMEGFLDKRDKTNEKRLGCKNPMQSEKCKKKRDDTNLKRHGEKSYTQTEEYWTNRKEKCLMEKGVEHESQLPENRQKASDTCVKRYNKTSYSKTPEFRERYRKTFGDKNNGIPNPLCLKKNHKYGKAQEELRIWLNSFGFNFVSNCYNIIEDDKELDLYDNNIKLAIEYLGLYWHTERSKQPRDRFYHYNKYIDCQKKGIRLITIFEDEWKRRNKQCKAVLLSIFGIYDYYTIARKCKVINVDKEVFRKFCVEHHIMGSDNNGLSFYGLAEDDNLLGVMSVGRHPRYSDRLAMNRLCFKNGVHITGGAGKLFTKCKQDIKNCLFDNMKTNNIVTWSNNRWSLGNVYPSIGFTLKKENGPDYDYVDLNKPYIRLSKQSHTKKNIGCPENIQEHVWLWENKNYARIWDCGTKTWVFNF